MNLIWSTVNFALITLAAYFGVQGFYTQSAGRFDTQATVSAAVQPVSDAENPAQRPLSQFQAIFKRNIFKVDDITKQPAPPPPPPPAEDLKETELNLKLWGTITGASGITYAVIEEGKARQQNLYRVGDSVEEAKVKAILREKVVLTVKDKDEILHIQDLASAPPRRAPGRPAPARGPKRPGVARAPGEQITLEQGKIQAATKNLNQLMKGVRIRPHFTNGQPDGIRLSGIKPGTIFQEIGFKSGDIITGVNGDPIESVDDALKFYSSLKSENNVNLQIRRNGKEQTLNYNVE